MRNKCNVLEPAASVVDAFLVTGIGVVRIVGVGLTANDGASV